MEMNLGDTQVIIKECKKLKLSKEQVAYVLASAFWESNRTMKPIKEAYWLSEDWRENNLRYYPYYGRGYVQITWKENYLKAGRMFDVDFVNHPDKVMLTGYAKTILVRGMLEGWFTGKKLKDYINEDDKDYVGARRIVNGTDRKNEIAAIAQEYEQDLEEYKLSTGCALIKLFKGFTK